VKGIRTGESCKALRSTRRALFVLFLATPFPIFSVFAQSAYCQESTGSPASAGKYLNIADSRIYYEECGSGPNVVLLHDGLLHSNTWDGAWPALCKKYHALRYDRRGYGRSDPPKTLFAPIEDLFTLLTRLNVRRAIVVGNSSGGALAIDFALSHPEMVEGLFLVGPVVQGMETTDHFDDRAGKNSAPIAKGDLSEIHAPTSILVGEFDIPDVHAQGGAIQAAIPGAQRDILNNAGHLIQVEAPAAFVEKLGEFVNLQERKGIEVPAATLQNYAGKYGSGSFEMTVTLKDGQLLLATPGVPPLPLFAESQTKFFMKTFRVEIEFTKEAAGKAAQAIIYQGDGSFKVSRL
jgi:3-oxoadipate enol-lactonase